MPISLFFNVSGTIGEEERIFLGCTPKWSSIFVLILRKNDMGIAGIQRLVSMLPQCSYLAHLSFDFDKFNDKELQTLAGVLGQYQNLAYLDSNAKVTRLEESQSLASVLPQCTLIQNLNNLTAMIASRNFQYNLRGFVLFQNLYADDDAGALRFWCIGGLARRRAASCNLSGHVD